jgi:hypothetical protein
VIAAGSGGYSVLSGLPLLLPSSAVVASLTCPGGVSLPTAWPWVRAAGVLLAWGWLGSRVAAALDDHRGAGGRRAVLTGVVDRVGSHAGRLANVRSVARKRQCGSRNAQGIGICVPC